MDLRPYQKDLVDGAKSLLFSGERKIIIQLPTGGGKTVIFSIITKLAQEKGSKVLILTDRIELLKQTGNTLSRLDLKPNFITSETKTPGKNLFSSVFVAMPRTLYNRLESKDWERWLNEVDLIIIDECHKQEFNFIFDLSFLKDKPILGFTATPWRTKNQRPLSRDYKRLLEVTTTKELVELDHLVPEIYYSPVTVDTRNVSLDSKGDFNTRQMGKRFDNPILYSGIVKAYKTHTPGTTALCFCTNILHCVKTCEELNKAGISSKFVCSSFHQPKPLKAGSTEAEKIKHQEKMNEYKIYKQGYKNFSGERAEIINQWKEGQFKILVNAGILTTGFDHPPTETIIIARATTSLSLLLQMYGRGSRKSPGKTFFNILDFGGNAERICGYQDKILWDLDGERKLKKGASPVKECGVIHHLNKHSGLIIEKKVKDKNGRFGCGSLIHSGQNICPECGYIYPKKEPKNVDLELKNTKVKEKTSKLKYLSWDQLKRTAEKNKYNWLWIYTVIAIRGGKKELDKFFKKENISAKKRAVIYSVLRKSKKI